MIFSINPGILYFSSFLSILTKLPFPFLSSQYLFSTSSVSAAPSSNSPTPLWFHFIFLASVAIPGYILIILKNWS